VSAAGPSQGANAAPSGGSAAAAAASLGAQPASAMSRPAGPASAGPVELAATLRARLAPLAPTVLDIHDDGAQHVGHAGAAGGAGHFSVTIVSECFAGLPRLQRHQRVLREVADLLPHPIHALSIKALAPDEFPS
jgi:BolA protein